MLAADQEVTAAAEGISIIAQENASISQEVAAGTASIDGGDYDFFSITFNNVGNIIKWNIKV